jgi:hypothetical protein
MGRRTVVEVVDEQVAHSQRRLTSLGRRLLEARRRIEQSGAALLNAEQIEQERAERRGNEPSSGR